MAERRLVPIFVEDSRGSRFLIFSVPLPNRPPVFMCRKVPKYGTDKSGVVVVDSKKFLQLWRNDRHGIHVEQANGCPEIWQKERKYPAATNRFSHGYDNPVPLAYVSFGKGDRSIISYKFLWFGRGERQEQFHYVKFTNGVTRTIWLLSHGCAAFPVECEMPGAQELHRMAAAPETPFYTIGELASRYRN